MKFTFEADTQFQIFILPALLEFTFIDAGGLTTANSIDLSGSFYGEYVVITGAGSNMGLTIAPATGDATGASGTVDSLDFIFTTETISLDNMNFKLNDVFQALVLDYQSNPDAFLAYLFEQSWDLTLGNNADVFTRYDGGNLVGNDIIRGRGGNDDMYMGDGADKAYGGNGRDRLDGGAGADKLYGGNGADELIGASGYDSLYGDDGADDLSGDAGNDRLYGGAGTDKLKGGNDADILSGGSELDRLYGNSGADKLYGGNGYDRLYGGADADQLYGGRGNDHLYGGSGADDFFFRSGQGANVIHDFNATNNAEDIVLTDVTAIRSFYDLSNNHMEQVGADVVIADGAGLTITLRDVNINDLDANDFLF